MDSSRYVADAAPLAGGSKLVASLPFDDSRHLGKGDQLAFLDTGAQAVQRITVGRHPQSLTVGTPPGSAHEVVAVANRDDGTVSIVDAVTRTVLDTPATGRQPAALAFSPDGRWLEVVDSLDDELVTLRTSDFTVVGRVRLSLASGIGSGPSALSQSPDGSTAFVTLPADNAIAVLRRVDAAQPAWTLQGRIPTARYPTGVTIDPTRNQLWVAAGKDAGAKDDMPDPGFLEQVPLPSAEGLAAYSTQVAANNVVIPANCTSAAFTGIEHVVYVIRENKTYDEDLGDEPGGFPPYLMYGRPVTPNLHALAERFGLLTNFTAAEEVSDSGHQAMMGGASNDWVQRFVQQSYGLDGAPRPGAELGNNDDTLWGPGDYLLDRALAAGISFRDYGEFYREDQSQDGPALTPALDSHIVHDWPGFGFSPDTPDTRRAAFWRQQFATDVAQDTFPKLEVVYLPEDHTSQGNSMAPLPQQQVADSDLATGQIIESLSHSRYWGSTAVFLAEDDPQTGMDSVDEHRTVGLVVSPHAVGGVSAVPYDQYGMLRTIEEILHLTPLTEHDATARPLDALFDPNHVDLRPYDVVQPTVPPVTPATVAAVHALSRDLFGASPTKAELFDRQPTAGFRVQWLATHGQEFQPSARLPGPGPAAVTVARGPADPAAVGEIAAAASCDVGSAPTLAESGTPTLLTALGLTGAVLLLLRRRRRVSHA